MILIWLSKYISELRIVEIRELIKCMLIGDPKYRLCKYVLPMLNGRLCSIIIVNKLTKRSIPMYDCDCFYGNKCINYKYCFKYAKHKLIFDNIQYSTGLQDHTLVVKNDYSQLEYTLCRDCFLRPDINITNLCICNNIRTVEIKKKIFNFADFKKSITKYPYGFGYSYLKCKELNVIKQMPFELIKQQFLNNTNDSVLTAFNKINKVHIYKDIDDIEFIDDGIYGHWELHVNGYIWMHTKISGHIKSDYEDQYDYINQNCKIIWTNNYTNSYYVCNLQLNDDEYIVL